MKKQLSAAILITALLTAGSSSAGEKYELARLEVEGTVKPETIYIGSGGRGVAGNYLAGRHAQHTHDWDKASHYLRRVLNEDPDNADLQMRAMVLAMGAGDSDAATSLAAVLLDKGEKSSLVLAFLALDAIRESEYAKAVSYLNEMEEGGMTEFIQPLMKSWAYAGLGTLEIEDLSKNPVHAYHGILIAQYLDRNDETLNIIRSALDARGLSLYDLERVADFQATAGKNEEAISIYEMILKEKPELSSIQEKVDKLKAGEEIESLVPIPVITSPAKGTAEALLDMARILYKEFSDDSARVFTQMALSLDPDRDDALIMLATIAARNERPDDAIEQYMKTSPDYPYYFDAQHQAADLMAQSGRFDEAVALMDYLVKEYEDLDSLIAIGDLYRINEKFEDALGAYDRAYREFGDTVPDNYWHLIYARGMTLERLGKWKRAEEDLLAALEIRPDDPYILNYLGYGWADQGMHLEKSLEMIRKAASLRPSDGYITDSLGWVLYRLGRYDEAVEPLERAVELLPYDPVINDHLGDAYWQVGRKLEARFQWKRAINHTEDEKLAATITGKLHGGLPEDDGIQQASTKKTEPADP